MNATRIARMSSPPMARLVIVLLLLAVLIGCRGRGDSGPAPDPAAVASWSDMLTREGGEPSP